MQWFNRLLDTLSDFLAQRKGLLPIVGIIIIIINAIIQFLPTPTWLISSNLLLHIGLVIALLGLLLARAL